MKINVLVFPCGSQAAIEINNCLKESLRFEIFGASSVDDHGKHIYKNYIGDLPNISAHNFIQKLNEAINNYNIKYIIPTHDSVALHLMENRLHIGATIVASELETTKVCRYKSMLYERFKEYDFNPITYNNINDILTFPIFLKPDNGQGGKGTHIAYNKDELQYIFTKFPNLLLCEYLPGQELSIDCFTDRKGNLRLVSPRTRERTLSGISVKSRLLEPSQEITNIAVQINKELNFRGYWFFQLKEDHSGKFKLMEVSTRFASSASLTFSKDINLPLLTLLDFEDLDIDILPNNYAVEMDRAFINRFHLGIDYERVYVDLDDTLILRNEYCNEQLLAFLYQCLRKKREVVLITKHISNVTTTLNKFKIHPGLFSDVIHIKPEEHKHLFISEDKKSIFIDNSFAERKKVKEIFGTPTFDISNVECLLDWRG